MPSRLQLLGVVGALMTLVALPRHGDLQAQAGCAAASNPITCENAKAGAPASEWDVSGAGDSTLQGFATEFSVTRGDTQRFKVKTTASAFAMDIYRMGYYDGAGARKIATVSPTTATNQPACITQSATGLIDCGNWSVSASWVIPNDAVSGIYFARIRRLDNGGASHIFFVVRDDTGRSPLLFQTSDTTWQAYNSYGGNSLYVGSPAGRAYKVSYNRPFNTRAGSPEDWVFNAEYPMVRFLEANGYHVSYISGIDSDRYPAELLEHKVFVSVGHDEYWSGAQRANVEAARAAGVHLAFFSGNEVFWKTRWENSIDGANTPYRTLVCYKETHANAKIDPSAEWTGTWRDPRFSPPADGGRPENALTGTIFRVNSGTTAIKVPAEFGKHRFWRHTTVATLIAGAEATLGTGTLGYEWDEAPTDAAAPPALMRLSDTTLNAEILLDHGSTYGFGPARHHLTMYRHASGALVFGAGTVQWSWGLDANHDRGSAAPDVRMQQATVNLFADMTVHADTLQPGLVPATPSLDALAPLTLITSPTNGQAIPAGTPITITGTAADAGGGIVMGVEVSVDNGVTWAPASGTTAWSYTWTAFGSGSTTIRSRAFDDTGNLESPSPGVTVTITGGAGGCPCTIWAPTAVPPEPDDLDGAAIELGTRFRSDEDGFITGVRFYKAPLNTGTHTGKLWTRTGTLLGSVTFTNETASGWQQANFATPIAIAANTTYVVSYHAPNGHYTGTDHFFTTSLDRPPLHGLRDGVDGANGVYRYGASSFPTDTYLSEAYWVDVVFVQSIGPDTVPPTIIGNTPAHGASGVSAATTVTATFSEAMDPASIFASSTGGESGPTAGTFELRDSLNALVSTTVTYDSTTRTATLRPKSQLALATTYTVLVRGGGVDPRVKDVAGNALAAPATWSFTTSLTPPPPPPTCPCSVWNAAAAPPIIDDNDPAAVELGMRFRSDIDGFISGVRFYKAPLNTGTHVGSLWSNSGVLLGRVTFTNETISGWQQANFASPVPITANTTYVVSYHAPNGHYSGTDNQFANQGVDNPPLHALKTGVDGFNGVYRYGTSGFPTETWNAEGYWVDVVLVTTFGPDTLPPHVVATTPGASGSGVATNTNVTVTFSEDMAASSIGTTTLVLRDDAGAIVPAVVSYNASLRTATLNPTPALATLTRYTVTVAGGAVDPRVKDLAGNVLTQDYVWAFTTAAPPPPPPSEGPGGPILVVTSSAQAISTYYAEILRTEGFNAFATRDLSAVDGSVLAGYDVVILGSMPLTAAQVTMFSDWVAAGGNLIAMRPDKQLAALLGLTDLGTTLANGYVAIDTTRAPGAGLEAQTLQFHGTADQYALDGATALATLYSTASAPTPSPAATLHAWGAGTAVAFTYDLANSVVQTRQGNPAWSGQERDGFPPIRSNDLFFGARTGDIQPDWIDFSRVHIPQADEQQRLLTNVILHSAADRKPLPRFWYFPRMLRAVVIMTGDDHGNNGTEGRFNTYLVESPSGCSVADWECVRATSYIYPETPLTAAKAAEFDALGFEVALHVTTNCADYTAATLPGFFTTQLADFAVRFPGVTIPVTNRTHCIAFSDYHGQPQVEATNGIRFDTNYYYWPPGWVNDRPGLFTGSGLPMRFTTLSGQMIDVYQAATQITDESGQTVQTHIDALLDRAIGGDGYYVAVTANMHTDIAGSPGSDAIVASARARGIPVISARQMLQWLDGRHASSFGQFVWSGNQLRFDVAIGAGAQGLSALLPATAGDGSALTSLTLNGVAQPFSTQVIKGVSYSVFTAHSGTYEASYGIDVVPPAIANVGATVSGLSATVSWTTDESSDSVVHYGTSPAALTQTASDSARTTSHTVTLTRLESSTTYYYRVASTDAAGNGARSPAEPLAPASFATSTPLMTIGDASVLEGDAGVTTASVTVSISSASTQTVTVDYATSSGSASQGSDYTGASGTLSFAPGETSQTIPLQIHGDTVAEGDEVFSVTLSAPAHAQLADAVGTVTIRTDDPLPTLSIGDASVTEGDSGTVLATFEVTLTGATESTVTVQYATAAGTAQAPADFQITSGSLTFAPGVTAQSLTVPVNGDLLDEDDEHFTVSLSVPVNATIATAQGTGTIVDNDPLPSLTVNDISLNEGQAGTTNAVFTVTLSAASGRQVSVAYATSDGTATAGSDYVATAGTAIFAPGQTQATVLVPINGDTVVEPDETLLLTLNAPANATLARTQASALIRNDEGAPPPSGLVAAFGFEEGSGTTTADSSGAGNHGTLAGATWSTQGRTGRALSFDGLNDMVTIADSASLDATRITMMAWVYPTTLSGWRTALLKESVGGLAYALYAHDNSPRPAAYVNTSNTDRRSEGTVALPLNTWSHLAATYDGANLRLYVNGVLVRTRAVTGNITVSAQPLRIGGNTVWGEYFAGVIDDVRIYNRALTTTEVQADMNKPVTP